MYSGLFFVTLLAYNGFFTRLCSPLKRAGGVDIRAWLDANAEAQREFAAQVACCHETGSAEEGQDVGAFSI
jgi:hypothetical protein